MVVASTSTGEKVMESDVKLEKVLSDKPTLKREKIAFQHLVESRRHIPLISPKYQPEVAGVGIDSSREIDVEDGDSKGHQQRRRNSSKPSPENQHISLRKNDPRYRGSACLCAAYS